MNIPVERYGDYMSFESFCGKHGINLVVHERSKRLKGLKRWYCSAKHLVEISDGVFLYSVSGDGDTPDEAIENYKRRILGQKLKIHNKVYVDAPNEWREDG